MRNVEMAAIFSRIGDLLEIQGDNPFKIKAYRQAAATLADLDEPAVDLIRQGAKIPGFGEAITAKIQEMEETGNLRFYQELSRKVPITLLEVVRVPGLGPKTAKTLHDQLAITNLDELEAAARAGKLAGLKGVGPRRAAQILQGIEEIRSRSDRSTLGAALQLADAIEKRLRARPEVRDVAVAGSLRRLCDTVGDVDLVVTSEAPLRTIDAFCTFPFVAEVVDRGGMEASIVDQDRLRADLLVVQPDRFGAALLYLTGSRAHNEWLAARAAARGFRFDERGLFEAATDQLVAARTEEEVYRALDLPWIPPEIREPAALPLAERHELPPLVSLDDIRGDLHTHTTWSDGTQSIEQMAEAARARGYRYLAICDHSRGLGFVGGLNEERLLEQVRQIRQLNERYDPAKFRVLAGTEMEIRADGSLDFDDATLAQLDFVVASIHSGFRQDREFVTERLVRAIRNPFVNLIGHPTGRLINQRAGYDFDRETVFRAAAVTGTALEINAHWARLDLKDEDAALAHRCGATLSINSDAHDAGGFDVMRFGVGTARRAWLPPTAILNTLGLEALQAFVRRKRERTG